MNVSGLTNEMKVYVAPMVQETSVKTEPQVTNKSSEDKPIYSDLAVGTKEKELKRLGLTDEEDGVVTKKQESMTPWECLQEEELKKEEKKEIREEELEKEQKKKERLEEEEEDEECETCENRKYQDGSDEMVSFKSASHIAPEAAATTVRAHEQEHVSNAYKKAETDNGEVQFASVAIHTAICPECGRVYVSGGTTTTTIKYNNDDYATNAKKQDATVVPGTKIDEMK